MQKLKGTRQEVILFFGIGSGGKNHDTSSKCVVLNVVLHKDQSKGL